MFSEKEIRGIKKAALVTGAAIHPDT